MNQKADDAVVLGYLAQLESSLAEDATGERARSILGYFDDVTRETEAVLHGPLPDEERNAVSQQIEGLRASQRIVQHIWETMHSAPLFA